MNKIFTLPLLTLPFLSFSQEIDCGLTDEISNRLELKKREIHVLRSQAKSSAVSAVSAETVYTIPVVVHIYHLGESEGNGSNITNAKVQGFINTINETYGGTGVSAGITPDAKIQFTLATTDPFCNSTNGIVRVNASGISGYAANQYHVSNSTMHNQLRALSDWDSNRYLNIRVVYTNSPLGIGYFYYDAFIPYARMNGDAGNRAFLTHEVGHTLALAHTFKDGGGCVNSDGIDDTPVQLQGSGCDPNAPTGCGGTLGNAVYNFLSYYSCRDRFTDGQIAYMRETLEYYTPGWRATAGTLTFGTGSQSAGTYKATNTITSSASVANDTYYLAGKSILLNAGFQAGENEVFEAKIGVDGGCP